MTTANYTRPNYSTQSGTVYPANIDAMAKVFERSASAFAPHEQTAGSPAPDLTVIVDAGPVLDLSGSAPDLNEMAQQTVSGFTIPSAGQTRIDRVVINDATGLAERIAGTAVTTGGSPSAAPPDIPANRLPVCQVSITSADTAITNDMLTDERCGIPIKVGGSFASGTRMLFQQTSAPTGWTKESSATYNDAALRLQTGTVTTGGADAFSTHFGTGKSSAGFTLTTAEAPAHVHTLAAILGAVMDTGPGSGANVVTNGNTGSSGGGGSHSHTLSNFNIKFADVIIAQKD